MAESLPNYRHLDSQRIIETNREYLARGGRFVVLCPETRVVGKDGDIAI